MNSVVRHTPRDAARGRGRESRPRRRSPAETVYFWGLLILLIACLVCSFLTPSRALEVSLNAALFLVLAAAFVHNAVAPFRPKPGTLRIASAVGGAAWLILAIRIALGSSTFL